MSGKKKQPDFTRNVLPIVKKMQRARDQWGHFTELWAWLVTDSGWKVETRYHNSLDDMPEDSTGDTVASTAARWDYLEGVIDVNCHKLANADEEEIEYFVVHELTHCLLAGMQKAVVGMPEQLLEHTVTNVARALVKARR